MSSIEKVLAVYKPLGITPVQLIERVRQKFPHYAAETISFAGRLDPMAEGVMLLLVGEENKNRQAYLNLEKVYQFEVLFGLATDTFDILGLVTQRRTVEIDVAALTRLVNDLAGTTIEQSYPPYSSKHIQGKALFDWAKEDRLAEIEIPSEQRTIHAAALVETYMISREQLQALIFEKTAKVTGNFRQAEIIKRWTEVFAIASEKQQAYGVAKIKAAVSSGTYVRSLADRIGAQLGSCALALSITRTQVGKYTEQDCIRL